VLAYTQAGIESPTYLEVPKHGKVKGAVRGKHALKLKVNWYGMCQAGRVWNQHLTNKLTKEQGFVQSKVDPCVFYKEGVILAIYTDDTIVFAKDNTVRDRIVKELESSFNISSEGDIADFLGVKLERLEDGGIQMTQPHLIESILKDLHLDAPNAKGKQTPAAPSKILQRHADSPDAEPPFHYRSVIGKLAFLDKSTRPDISYAVHQCARFAAAPKQQHVDAVKHIGRYLLTTRDKGMIYHPDDTGLICFADADFAGNWSSQADPYDPSVARSRTGYIISFAGCPIAWKSAVQTETATSTTVAEYLSLSTSLRDVIPLLQLMRELREQGFKDPPSMAQMHCKCMEDNVGALEMARIHKLRPRTKFLATKWHHFREYVDDKKEISVHKVSTEEQLADIATKPLAVDLFTKFRNKIMGWSQELREGV